MKKSFLDKSTGKTSANKASDTGGLGESIDPPTHTHTHTSLRNKNKKKKQKKKTKSFKAEAIKRLLF